MGGVLKRVAVALGLALVVTGCRLVLGMEPSYDLLPAPETEAGADAPPDAPPPTLDACPDGGCKECVPGDFRCIGVALQQCANGFFKPLETCESADKCSATGGNCLGIYCTPGQRRCNQDRLERCNASQTMFEVELSCGVGLCDAVLKRCNKCVPAANIGCADAQTIDQCADDGQSSKNITCPQPTPKCVASSASVACLQCASDTHCSTVLPCRAPQCANSTCTTKADPAQEGRILVPAEDLSCVQTVCKNGVSAAGFLPAGTKCGQGQGFAYFCQADGQCVGAP